MDRQRPDINTGPKWLPLEMKGDSDPDTGMTLAHPPDADRMKSGWVNRTGKIVLRFRGQEVSMSQWHVATNKAVVTVTSLR